eukprot:m.24106 g.24106  ORF g.24106 m.24106 type:complete len:426 (-) comp6027_c0_seq1:128-1405(-)
MQCAFFAEGATVRPSEPVAQPRSEFERVHAMQARLAQLRARGLEIAARIEREQRMGAEVTAAIERAEAELAAAVAAPVASGEDPTLWLPDELLLLVLLRVGAVQSCALVCTRWRRLCRDRALDGSWLRRFAPYATGQRAPRQLFGCNRRTIWAMAPLSSDRVLSAGAEGVIEVYSTPGGVLEQSLYGHTGCVRALVVGSDLTLYSGATDATVRIWGVVGKKGHRGKGRTLKGHSSIVNALAVSTTHLFSGSDDCSIRVWQLSSGDRVRTLKYPLGGICALALDGHGQLYSGATDSLIQVWSVSDYTLLRTLVGHTGVVDALVIGLDGALVSGSWDKTIRVWSAGPDGELLQTLHGHTSTVHGLVAGPDDTVISESDDGTWRAWRIRPDEQTAPLSIAVPHVSAIAVTSRGDVWAGTENGDLYLYE